jgi:hypothetical protein
MSNKFFYVHNGLTVGGLTVDANSGGLTTFGIVTTTNVTNATTSSFSGALQVGGGASILKDLWVGGTAYAAGAQILTVATIGTFGVTSLIAGTGTTVSTSTGVVTVWSTATLQNVTDRGNATTNVILIANNTNATTTGTGALVVDGGIGANNAYLNNLTVSNGSVLNGPVTFGGTVTFNGSATYVLSTNTFYTDNILELHTPPGGVGTPWAVDDGKDIGLRFHYFTNSTNTNAALVLANDTKYLEWYNAGAENTATFAGSTYGTFKTGSIILVDTTASNSTITGALIVAGGVGVGGNINVAGVVTATLFSGAFQGNATAAYNLIGGTAGQLPYQVSPNLTSFISTATQGWLLMSQPGVPAYVNTSSIYVGYAGAVANAPTTANANYYPSFFAANSGAVQTLGTTASFYVNAATGVLYANVFNGSADQITTGTIKNSALVSSTIIVSPGNAGIGIGNSPVSLGGTVLISNFGVLSINGGATGLTPAAATTGTVTLGGVLNLSSGGTSATNVPSPGSIVYGGANSMVFNTPGTPGQVLLSNGTSAPVFSSSTNITAGYAITATNILGGVLGAMPYQLAPGITGFIGTGTAGFVLAMGGANTATWTTTANLTAGNATTATNIQNGSAGYIPIQSAIGITSYINTGSVGNILQQQVGNTATFVTTGSIQVGFAVSATNVLGGTPGQLVYQVSTGTTGFINTGSQGNLLVSQPGAPAYTSTGSIYVGAALFANLAYQANSSTNVSGGAAGSIPIQSATGTTSFIALGTVGQVLQVVAGSTASWQSLTALTVGRATTATYIDNGATGTIPIQSALGITSFISTGSVGSFLSQTSQTTSSFVTTASMYINAAVYSNNLFYGNAGAIPIQTAANGTSFISSGTAGALLMAGVNTATFVATASIYVNRATIADLANTSSWATTATYATNVIGGIVSASQVVIVGNLGVTGTTTLSGLLYATNTSTFSSNVITNNVPVVYDQTGISVGVAQVTIDSFSTSTYRSAKYVITISNSPQYQSTEALVIHDGTTPYLQDVSVFTGASPIMLFTVGISGGNVLLQGTGTAAGNTVKVQRIYTTV